MRPMRPPRLLLPFLLFFAARLLAQSPESLGKDLPFFQKQANTYGKWLDQAGLGQLLRVQDVEVRGDTACILYLGFYATDADTVLAQWERLKLDYKTLLRGDSLEKELYDRMLFLMAVPPGQGEIRLFNTYDLSITPCFARRIYTQNGQLRTAVKFCKSEDRQIRIAPCNVSRNGKPISAKTFQQQFSKAVLFQKLKPFLTQKYAKGKCDGRIPKITFLNDTEELHFEVRDLCREILIDESNPWWCEVLYGVGYLNTDQKNCIKRERLVAHITYEKNDGESGFVLKTKIDGAYGSGWYDNPRDNGYHDIQTDYPEYLRRYADKLNEEILQFLLKP